MADDPKDASATDDKKDDALGDGGKKALDAERAARKKLEDELKELRPLVQKAKEADDAKKNEAQRLTEQITKMQTDLDEERRQRRIIEVAADKGLTPAHVKRLSGSSKEELEASADELLEDFPIPPKVDGDGEQRPAPTSKPREVLKPGNNEPDAPAEETDVRKLGARMFSH